MLLDEDVKIYGGTGRDDANPDGEGERSAAAFLQHRENGNLTKCWELGRVLADSFVTDARQMAFDPYARQKMVLLSFILSDELAGIIFDQMLQKSALSVFQQTVESLDRGLFSAITDSAAFTLYMLDDRDANSLGATFAVLCGRENDADLIREADTLVNQYHTIYADIISCYTFVFPED